VLGGVAAGVARTLGIDVIIVRIVFVIAAFVWIGIPLYIVAWIALPWDDGTRDFTGDGEQRDIGMIAALGLIGLGALIFVQHIIPGGWHSGGRFIGPLLLIAGGVTILVLRRPGARIEQEPEPALEPPGAAIVDAPPAEPTDAEPADATDEGYGDPLPDLPTSAWTQTAPWATIRQERREQRRARRAQRRRPFITPVTLSILLIGAGVALFIGASGIADVNLAVVFAIGTITVGVALLVSTWVGRAYGLIAVGVILALCTAVTATLDVPLRGGVGETIEKPATSGDIRGDYHHGIGHFVLDLRSTQGLAGTQHDITVEQGVGELQVLVPRNAVISVRSHVGAGAIDLFAAQRHGWDVQFNENVTIGQFGAPLTTGGAPTNAVHLNLSLRVGAGHIEVKS
jgi:phage shock protein PspC (stress-responsive transcriptional regulator)/predicted membrane protein